MRRVPDLRIQVAPLIVSVILSRSKISRRGLARALLPSVVPELPIRSRIFAPEGCLSQVAGAVTGSLVNTNILLGCADHTVILSFFLVPVPINLNFPIFTSHIWSIFGVVYVILTASIVTVTKGWAKNEGYQY